MFFGTRIWFKISYFWTSMIPAYIIFLARTYSELGENIGLTISIIFVIFSVAMIITLLVSIKKQISKFQGTKEIEVNFNPFRSTPQKEGVSNVPRVETEGFYKVNPGLISYLLGTVFSSGTLSFVSSNSIITKFTVFIVVQLLIWFYVQNSSDSVPNIILLVFGKDLVSVNDKYWILMTRNNLRNNLTGIKTIVPFASTDARNRLYVVQGDANAED
ncbi:hypothetical protein [Streptococcus mutans]|uniref:hypothetical protein n=1 Tax=Streptococcus mutans TaxID=1309 RepID=UPI00066DFAE0|nr:hypothetical protein [Streptococcus mutans]MCY7115493.1 hypothetical protein [Streptococcus mutans]QIQ93606.1 hypothetical protein HB753_03505 [Streptococcus mutans]QIQ99850.1 hypothetical protein HB752_03505 [Streptococcus mutans]QIR01496.1 hypothetical protein HB751_02120 [Streptococcus mutans]QIR03627.1 hypothetical protein HB750_03505 [Streptococcus mutans]